MNRKFISKSNYVLHKVLNSKQGVEILKDFIESILEIEIKEISLNPYLEKIKNRLPAEENFGIADVRIKTNEDEEMNIGVQFIDGEHISTKMLLYYAQIHLNQVLYENRKIAKTITINLLDFYYSKKDTYFNKIIIDEKNSKKSEMDLIELISIELPKFKVKEENKMSKKEAWISYFKGENVNYATKKYNKIAMLDKLLIKYWDEEVIE